MSRRARRAVIRAAREMECRGLVVGSTGNASVRLRDGVAITPTRAVYETMRCRDLVVTTPAGEVVRGRGTPSRELPLHLAVYAARPDVGAVIHTHSPHATAWSLRGRPLDVDVEDLGYYDVGEVRCAPYAPPGTAALAANAAAALASSRAVLLGRHGVLAVGRDPADALLAARVVEHVAQVAGLCEAQSRRVPVTSRYAAGIAADPFSPWSHRRVSSR